MKPPTRIPCFSLWQWLDRRWCQLPNGPTPGIEISGPVLQDHLLPGEAHPRAGEGRFLRHGDRPVHPHCVRLTRFLHHVDQTSIYIYIYIYLYIYIYIHIANFSVVSCWQLIRLMEFYFWMIRKLWPMPKRDRFSLFIFDQISSQTISGLFNNSPND